jgi:thioesterase domain-containing protein
VRYLRTNDGSEFRKFDFSAFELGQIRSMIECWLEDIKKYPPEGEFTIISAGHSVNDLFELKRLVNGE